MDEGLAQELKQQGFRLIETHISRVYLSDQHVFKTKRPVNLGFLDFGTLAARERACEAEVLLNRRLAPDVYLGVVALVRDERGRLGFVPREQLEGRELLDVAVHMRRLSDHARADVRLHAGQLDRQEVEQIARLIARFHAQARSDAETAAFGRPDTIVANVEENFAQVQRLVADHLTPDEESTIERYQREFMQRSADAFARRVALGCVRDGHGDLRLEHIYRNDDGGHVIIDCIEFNERFRYADVCADLAFLSMDLRSHGRADLAEALVAAYAEASADYGVYEMLDFYESYRAFVRAKVASFLAHDSEVSSEARAAAWISARRHFLLALSCSRPALNRPRLIVCMGIIASGKSTLAEALAKRIGAGVLCADRIRKQLLAVAPEQPMHDAAFAGGYAPDVSERVYKVMRERAALVLRSGRSAILDATFRERRQRSLLRELAAEFAVDVLFLECRCSRATAMQRLHARAQSQSVSDGRAEIYDAVAASAEPTTELDSDVHLVLDTELDLEHSLAAVLESALLYAPPQTTPLA